MKLGEGPKPVYRTTEDGFVPVNELAVEFFRKCRLGQDVMMEGRRPRLLAHHNKFWKLMSVIAHNSNHYPTARMVANAFLFGTGRYHEVRYKDYIDREPDSLSFASMDQTEFEAFYNEAIQFLITVVIPGLDEADLERELMKFAA